MKTKHTLKHPYIDYVCGFVCKTLLIVNTMKKYKLVK